MFNSFKKAIVRYFTPKKLRRVVTTPATPDVEATGAARAEFVKCLRAVLTKKLRAVTDAVDGYANGESYEVLRNAIIDYCPVWAIHWEGDKAALCAAIEWYEVAEALDEGKMEIAIERLGNAIKIVNSRDYKFYYGVDNFGDLGYELFAEEIGVRTIANYLVDYFDCESFAEDCNNDLGGKFTRFGFFAPARED